jgi:ABC-type multidrug transport system fused ATPase/permease subunit
MNEFTIIRKLFEKKEKIDFLINCILSVIVAINEAFGVGAVVLFIGYASDPNKVIGSKLPSILKKFGLELTALEFIIFFGGLLIFYYFLRSILNVYFGYRLIKYSEEMYSSIAKKLLDKYLKMQYVDFLKRGPTFIQKMLVSETYNFTHVISAGLMLVSEAALLLLLFLLLLYTDLYATVAAILFLCISLLITKKMITGKMAELGAIREKSHKRYYDSISNLFRNYKYIKTANKSIIPVNQFHEHVSSYVGANVRAATLSLIPKSVLEFLGYLVIISLFIYVLIINKGSITDAIPILAMFSLGLMRMLPSVNRIVTSFNQIQFHKNTVNLICAEALLKAQDNNSLKLIFNNYIEVSNLDVHTNEGQLLLKDSSLIIKKYSKIGIIGGSGVGKTTLVDVLLGLHQEYQSIIKVDDFLVDNFDRLNLKSIASFIPQRVYLFDGSVGQNISMSIDFDPIKVESILKKVDLDKVFSAREGLDTQVGEDGLLLSGGQLQRLGIARALYNDSEIIIMDEPTSSVDPGTATLLMNKIYELSESKTLIIISHQIDILKKCESIYEIKNHKINLVSNT